MGAKVYLQLYVCILSLFIAFLLPNAWTYLKNCSRMSLNFCRKIVKILNVLRKREVSFIRLDEIWRSNSPSVLL